MRKNKPTVVIVDDDPAICKFLTRLIQSVGLEVKTYNTADEFLQDGRPSEPSCLVLDVRMPGLSGLELQELITKGDHSMPVIFMTGCQGLRSPLIMDLLSERKEYLVIIRPGEV